MYRWITYSSLGAGHPGEEDIGGLVLVCPPRRSCLVLVDELLYFSSLAQQKRSKSRTLPQVVLLMPEGLLLLSRWVLRFVLLPLQCFELYLSLYVIGCEHGYGMTYT